MATVAEVEPVKWEADPDPTPKKLEYQGVEIVETPEDVDYDALKPVAATAALIASTTKRDYTGFRLTHTQIARGVIEPLVAKVRLVNLTDKAMLDQVPREIRAIVQKLFFTGTPNQRGRKQERETPEQRMDAQLKRMKEVGYAYGVAGFLEPKLVLNPADADPDRGTLWVGDIELADLTAFVRICEGDDQLAARQLEEFPE